MTERAQRAQDLRNQKGYNCAQAVICAYCDLFGMDENAAYKVSEGFGAGMGIMDICGALSASVMLAGLKNSGGIEQPGATKGATNRLSKTIITKFQEKNGTHLCRELKGVTDGVVRRDCPGCIADACELIEELLLD